ncbi:MAG: endonuclease/exonuclease/phosphatase family protein, partial [Candidatus Methylomirabilales bacterium]
RVQYFFFLLASVVILLIKRKQRRAIAAGAFALINLSLIIPFYIGSPTVYAAGRTHRALLFNVNTINQSHKEVGAFIHSQRPDFMVLVEVGRTLGSALQKTRGAYPFSASVLREDGFGIALISRIPFENAEIVSIGEREVPSVIARFEIDGQPLTVIGIHAHSPVSQTHWRYRNSELADLTQVASSQKGHVMILGDLNTTSWSPFFRDLLRKTGLRDSRNGFGVQPTWPTVFPPLWIPIDHCLLSSGVVVHNRRIESSIGSDHYPVVVDFSVEPL